nr:structural protein [Tolivirales sp.]
MSDTSKQQSRSKSKRSKPSRRKNSQGSNKGRPKSKNNRGSNNVHQNIRISGSGKYSIGRQIGSSIGGFVGEGAEKLISSIVGFGDYKISENTLLSSTPSFPPCHELRIAQTEFIGSVTGNISFTQNQIRQIPIYPGNSLMFPWLSQIVRHYEEYEVHGLVFHYKPTSGSAISGTNSALGVVVMATQYNPYSKAFSSRQEMEQYQYSTSGVPSQHQIHGVECALSLKQQPILSTHRDVSKDLRFTDLGTFNLLTTGQQANGTELGELWVSYDMTLKKKIKGPVATQDVYDLPIITSTKPLGYAVTDTTKILPNTDSNFSSHIIANVLHIPSSYSGDFVIELSYDATTVDGTNYITIATLTDNIKQDGTYLQDNLTSLAGIKNDNSVAYFKWVYTKVSPDDASLTFSSSSINITGFKAARLFVYPIN